MKVERLDEEGPVDLNWTEHVRNALKAGKLTTIITFDNCQYQVTLQPYTPPATLGTILDICAACAQIVQLSSLNREYPNRWYHQDPKDGRHPAEPLYHVLVGGKWVVKGTAPASRPVASSFEIGQIAACYQCGGYLRWEGEYWVHTDHFGNALLSTQVPNHIGVPVAGSPYA